MYTPTLTGARAAVSDTLSGALANYGYDQADRLIRYNAGFGQYGYTYDGDGLRQAKALSGTTEAYTWDTAEGLPQLVQDGSTQYVMGPGGLPLESVGVTGSVTFYYQDQLGSTRALLNGAGQAVGTYSYSPYGTLALHTGSATTPFGFAGQYTDHETGFQYLQARYYDPATAQFITRDPLASQTLQPYAYVSDNPLNGSDPSGLWCLLGQVGDTCPPGALATPQTVTDAACYAVPTCALADLLHQALPHSEAASNADFNAHELLRGGVDFVGETASSTALLAACGTTAGQELLAAQCQALGQQLTQALWQAATTPPEQLVAQEFQSLWNQGQLAFACNRGWRFLGHTTAMVGFAALGAESAAALPSGAAGGASAGLPEAAGGVSTAADTASQELGPASGDVANNAATGAEPSGTSGRSDVPLCEGCFAAGTLVATPQGERAIETLQVGDTVLSEDPTKHKVEAENVQAVLHDSRTTLVAVDLSDGSTITTTATHSFWVDAGLDIAAGGTWLYAEHLRSGDQLRTASGADVAVLRVHLSVGTAEVYTLTVAKDHTFFVGPARVLVHNAKCVKIKWLQDIPGGTPLTIVFQSEGEARAFVRTKIGSDPLVGADYGDPWKLRTRDQKWQYRAKPGDIALGHIHLEELDPRTGRVIRNFHLEWPVGTGR